MRSVVYLLVNQVDNSISRNGFPLAGDRAPALLKSFSQFSQLEYKNLPKLNIQWGKKYFGNDNSFINEGYQIPKEMVRHKISPLKRKQPLFFFFSHSFCVWRVIFKNDKKISITPPCKVKVIVSFIPPMVTGQESDLKLIWTKHSAVCLGIESGGFMWTHSRIKWGFMGLWFYGGTLELAWHK